MAIGVVQTWTTVNVTGTEAITGTALTAGSVMVFWVAVQASKTITPPASVNSKLKFVDSPMIEMFTYTAVGGETTFTFSYSGGTNGTVWAVEFSSLTETANGAGATNGSGASSVTTLSSGTTETTTQADELIIAGFGLGGTSGASVSISNSFTQPSTNTNSKGTAAYKIVAATGTYETTWAWTTSRRCAAAILALKGKVGVPLFAHHYNRMKRAA